MDIDVTVLGPETLTARAAHIVPVTSSILARFLRPQSEKSCSVHIDESGVKGMRESRCRASPEFLAL